jgi:hypothetical protein
LIQSSARVILFAGEKPKMDRKKGLRTSGEGRKSRKRPPVVVGKKPI